MLQYISLETLRCGLLKIRVRYCEHRTTFASWRLEAGFSVFEGEMEAYINSTQNPYEIKKWRDGRVG